ncbi:MAG TPA: VOC family protein [Ktedonobacteraceae bacterium]
MTMMSSDTPESEPAKTSIAPWLSVSRATEAVDYYKAAFGAVERYRLEDGAGKVVVAQLAIEGADFWLQEDVDSSPESVGRGSVRMILTVDNPDPVFEQAIAAGATEVVPVSEDHGWRIGRVADPFGHHWEIGKPLR